MRGSRTVNRKILTGEVIHREFLVCVQDEYPPHASWDELTPDKREMYNKVANRLNVWLGQDEPVQSEG